jgi:hypothetical protein
MRTVQYVLAWTFGLILVFLALSRAAEFNTIINTLGGFFSTQTRNLQGYGPGGQLLASPATTHLNTSSGYLDPGWSGPGARNTGLGLGSINLADWFQGSQGGQGGDWASVFGLA